MRRAHPEVNGNKTNGKSRPSPSSARITFYVTEQQKREWITMMTVACEIDGIRNPDNGTFLGRIIRAGLSLDKDSIAKYAACDRRRKHP